VKTSTTLLLVSMLGLVLVAPPAYPQNTKDQLNSLMTDSINLKNSVIKLQESSDQKNAEIIKLLNETLARFATIETKMQTLNDNLTAAMKANDDKAARNVQETRTALDALKKDLDAGMVGMESQIAGLRKQFNDTKNTEQPLPTSQEVFSRAYSQLNQGFYEDAIGEFREFLKSYTDPIRVPAAQFYIGEALMAQRKPDQAVVQFDMFLEKYPNSDRKCLALYRKGQAHAELKETPKATAAMQAVVKDCAGSQEAANAAQELKSLPTPRRGQ
jgi:tol-pal system protein YbgF